MLSYSQQNEFKTTTVEFVVRVTFPPSSACVYLLSVFVFLCLCLRFSVEFLCMFSVLSAGMRGSICVCWLCMCYTGCTYSSVFRECVCVCFKQPMCRSSVTNKGFNAVLGSLMLLTSFSHSSRPHRADLSVPNHSILPHIVPLHILFYNITFCWNPFHFVPLCAKPFHFTVSFPNFILFGSFPLQAIPFQINHDSILHKLSV